MEQPLDCFKWHSHCSDYLDGTLPDSLKREADEHLVACRDCGERYKHFRLILSSIAGQPRAMMPAAIRKAPLSSAWARAGAARELTRWRFWTRLPRWEYVPWYLRTVIEGTGIVLIILVGITSAPKIRTLYEKSVDRNLTDFREGTSLEDTAEAVVPPLLTLPVKLTELDPKADPAGAAKSEDEISGEDDAEEESPKAGRSQLWRFTLKTVSPDELRPLVIKTLTELGIPSETTGLGGMQVPGGIEFDLILPDASVPNIKHSLSKLTPRLSEQSNSAAAPGPDNFSWYKVKSKRKLPAGSSQVVIWLSQAN